MSKFSQNILDKIKKEEIQPTSKWVFIMKNSLFWIIFCIAAITGGRAFAVVIRVAHETELGFAMQARGGMFPPFMRILPVFWVLFFLLFLIFSAYGLHHTKKGYKLQTYKLILINLFISALIGTAAFLAGDGERFEKYIHDRAPIFKMHEEKQRLLWSEPDEGRLGGEIIELKQEMIIILSAFDDETWTVDYSESERRKNFEPEIGYLVRIVGEQQGEKLFKAESIGPWKKLPPEKRRPRR